MKKTLHMLMFACVVLIATEARAQTLLTGPGEGNCATCVNVDSLTQDCARTNESGMGSHCIIFFEAGEQWCNWQGTCDPGFSALDLRLAGTFASRDVQLSADGILRSRCGGFIVAHQRSVAAAPREVNSAAFVIRI